MLLPRLREDSPDKEDIGIAPLATLVEEPLVTLTPLPVALLAGFSLDCNKRWNALGAEAVFEGEVVLEVVDGTAGLSVPSSVSDAGEGFLKASVQ
jgi:hypothetical protein